MQRFTKLAAVLATASILAACGGQSGSIPSQVQSVSQPSHSAPLSVGQQSGARPRDAVFHYNGPVPLVPGGLPHWTGSFKFGGGTVTYTMVGTNPATSNTTTTIPVDIIPVKVVIGTHTYDPNHVLSNGDTVIANTTESPIFQKGVDFKSGGVDLGKTQYIDAFQRGNFWSHVKTNTNYHVLLGTPTIEPTWTLHPGSSGGTGNPFGFGTVGLVDINYFDPQVQSYISSHGIPAGTLPIFVTYNLYLTQGAPNVNDCCIGGYHNSNGTNTWSHFTYIPQVGQFSQDVAALSHEIGEWYDDPFINNSACGGLMEVGDPEEGDANFGDFPYSLGGFTYHLQDLTYLPYFGAPRSTSVNNQFSFQNNTSLSVCSNGP